MSDDEESQAGIAHMMTPDLARNPQPTYRALVEDAPVMRIDGVGVIACSRAAVDDVLRQPEVFSSNTAAADLKSRRPLIPLPRRPPRRTCARWDEAKTSAKAKQTGNQGPQRRSLPK